MSLPSHLRCRGGMRHWFTVWGEVGNYVEKCRRCDVTRTQIREWQKEQRKSKPVVVEGVEPR